MKKLLSTLALSSSSLMISFMLPLAAKAATTITVTPNNPHGWTTDDTRPGGAVNFVYDTTSPAPSGALQLTTDSTTTAKAQYMHAANTPLGDVNELSYYTKQNTASFPGGDPSYQLPVFLNGTSASFTTLVYEPYENGIVTPGAWQSWDVSAGQFWSSRTVSSGSCSVVAGGGGAPFYSLAQLKASCPNAVVVGYGVNIGSNNPGYNVETDLFNFNGTVYDFQVVHMPTDKDQCKNGGYTNYTDANGTKFSNQGLCVVSANASNREVRKSNS